MVEGCRSVRAERNLIEKFTQVAPIACVITGLGEYGSVRQGIRYGSLTPNIVVDSSVVLVTLPNQASDPVSSYADQVNVAGWSV